MGWSQELGVSNFRMRFTDMGMRTSAVISSPRRRNTSPAVIGRSYCDVVEYYKKKGVDFCFQCDQFPCGRTNFDPHLEKRWRQMNMRMQEIAVEAYDEETNDLCRYLYGEARLRASGLYLVA